MKKITIAGYHGNSNLGDDYFLSFILKELQKRQILRATLIAKKGSINNHLIPDKFDLHCTLSTKTKFRGYDKIVSIFYHGMKTDKLIFCAGSIFTILPNFLFYLVIRMLKLLRPKLEISAIGVSVGPFPNIRAKFWLPKALKYFDQLILRDEVSLNRLKSKQNAVVSRDIAYLKPQAKFPNKDHSSLLISVHPYNSFFSDNWTVETERNEVIAMLVGEAVKSGAIKKVTIFVTCTDEKYGDDVLSNDLAAKLLKNGIEAKIVHYKTIEQSVELIQRYEKVISSRLHTGFFGLKTGGVIYQFAYADKIKNFYYNLSLKNMIFDHPYRINVEKFSTFLQSNALKDRTDFIKINELGSEAKETYTSYFDKLNG